MIPGLAQWIKKSSVAAAMVEVSAVAQIQSLAQELPYAVGAAIKLKKLLKRTMVNSVAVWGKNILT